MTWHNVIYTDTTPDVVDMFTVLMELFPNRRLSVEECTTRPGASAELLALLYAARDANLITGAELRAAALAVYRP